MTAVTQPVETGEPIAIPAWSWAAMVVALLASYAMLQDNGLLMSNWMTVHEFFHDARHAMGLPCH